MNSCSGKYFLKCHCMLTSFVFPNLSIVALFAKVFQRWIGRNIPSVSCHQAAAGSSISCWHHKNIAFFGQGYPVIIITARAQNPFRKCIFQKFIIFWYPRPKAVISFPSSESRDGLALLTKRDTYSSSSSSSHCAPTHVSFHHNHQHHHHLDLVIPPIVHQHQHHHHSLGKTGYSILDEFSE